MLTGLSIGEGAKRPVPAADPCYVGGHPGSKAARGRRYRHSSRPRVQVRLCTRRHKLQALTYRPNRVQGADVCLINVHLTILPVHLQLRTGCGSRTGWRECHPAERWQDGRLLQEEPRRHPKPQGMDVQQAKCRHVGKRLCSSWPANSTDVHSNIPLLGAGSEAGRRQPDRPLKQCQSWHWPCREDLQLRPAEAFEEQSHGHRHPPQKRCCTVSGAIFL